MPRAESGLTIKQELFVQEYLKDLNGKQAAIRAGYAEDSAEVHASRLLSNDKVSSRLRELNGERINRVQVEQDDVLRELLLVLKSSVEHYSVDEQGKVILNPDAPPEALRAVSGVKRRVKRYVERGRSREEDEQVEVEEVEYRLWDKTRAIDMSMRHLGLMTDKLRIEDPDGVLAAAIGVKKEDLP